MDKIETKANDVDVIDVRDAILSYLKEKERTLFWLSKKVDIKHPTMYSIFVQKISNLSEDKLEKINSVLETSFVMDKKEE